MLGLQFCLLFSLHTYYNLQLMLSNKHPNNNRFTIFRYYIEKLLSMRHEDVENLSVSSVHSTPQEKALPLFLLYQLNYQLSVKLNE